MKLGNRDIGRKHPAYIVAEVGINHSGNLTLAKYMMDCAKASGADAVKFQTRTPRICVPEDQWDMERDTPWGKMRYIDYKEKIEFTVDDYGAIAAHAKEIGIDWFTSVWDIPALNMMEIFTNLIAYKVPSPCLTDLALLEVIAKTGKPIILSTGMSDVSQINDAFHVITAAGVSGRSSGRFPSLIVCQCTSTYPCPPEEINLRALETVSNVTKAWYGDNFVLGYSGHEMGSVITIAAAALGAKYIERHFTSDTSLWGTDQKLSLPPIEFAHMVSGVRKIEAAMGDGIKRVYESEKPFMDKLRRVRKELVA